MVNSEYLKNLNNAQKETLRHKWSLLIVLVLDLEKRRFLHLKLPNIIKSIPNQILAVTFTNKAAKRYTLSKQYTWILNNKSIMAGHFTSF